MSYMEQCGAHEANLSSELDEETWQNLINELRTAYISDKELDDYDDTLLVTKHHTRGASL